MTFVVDASMAAAWILPDERDLLSEALLEQVETEGGAIPSIFWHEIRNILLKVERRGRSQPAATDAALGRLRRLKLDLVENGDDDVILRLGRHHNLSAYDAAYLDIAIRCGFPLVTADRRLASATLAAGATLLGPFAAPPP